MKKQFGYSIDQMAAKYFPRPIEFAEAKDTFGEGGKPMDLLKKLDLGVPDVMAASEKTMGRKQD